MFENDNSDFLVPLDLYVTRLRQLEDAFVGTNHNRGLPVETFYADDSAPEDSEFSSFSGRAVDFSEDPDQGHHLSHPSLSGSGYASVRVVWDQDGDEDILSPWEVSVRDADPPERPRLDENEKKAMRRALNIIRGLPSVEEYFRAPVNEDSYSDYPARVEVPMDLTFITNRLEADYYSTKYSVVADVRLIQTNCAKYNGDNDDLTSLAVEVVARFEENVLNEEERVFFHKYDAPLSSSQASLGDTTVARADAPSVSAVVQRRSQRQRHPPRSILENVSAPAEEFRRQRSTTTRSGRRVRSTGGRGHFWQESNSSILESVAQPAAAPTLEQRGRSRGRSTRTLQNNQRATRQSRSMPQRSARASSRSSMYQDMPSDIDEEGTEPSPRTAAARVTRRSTARGESAGVSFRRSLRPGLRNSGSQDLSSSDEDDDAQEFSRDTRTRRSSRRAEPASDHASAGSSDEDEEESSQSPLQRRATRGSSRWSPQGTNSSEADATSSEEQDANDSEFNEKSNEQEGSSDDDELSAESSNGSDSEAEIVSTRRSTRREGTRSRRSTRTQREDESVSSALSPRKRTRSGRAEEFRDSRFRSAHARSTKRGSYVDPSESEFGSDVESPPPAAPRRTKKLKTNNKKRKGTLVDVHFCASMRVEVSRSPFCSL